MLAFLDFLVLANLFHFPPHLFLHVDIIVFGGSWLFDEAQFQLILVGMPDQQLVDVHYGHESGSGDDDGQRDV